LDQRALEKFRETYGRLLVQEIQQRLAIDPLTSPLSRGDEQFLISIASMLAFGPTEPDEISEADWKRWSYDAATRLAEARAGTDARYCRAAEMILARLGNFPGRDFMRERYPNQQESKQLAPVLAIESLTHEAENTIEFGGLGQRTLTDFQIKLVNSLRRNHPVSVSAPTSAGKSYLLSLDIVSIIAERKAKVVVYVVPTRALIRQVMTDLLARLREAKLDEIAVSAAPIPLDEAQLNKGVIYVLTQERLLSLIYSPEGKVQIDALYVDEAQEIGDEDRGMILHTAVRKVVDTNPKARICFASPLTHNPGFLFSEFEIHEQGEFFVERQTPVSQAVIILDEIKGKPKGIGVTVLTPSGPRQVGTMTTSFEFRGVKDRLANTALLVTKPEESTIVYANGAAEAIEVALKIAELIEDEVSDQEVRDLTDFVRTHIHSQYALVDTLPKGVAFHYGKMPHLVRSQIEDLLRRRKLKYVVCTSTLLQGINLPARNIVILGPRKGNNRPMRSPDFWNLAGRAGRLRETFNGYIWCINPKTWDEDPLNGDQLSEMKSSFRASLEDSEVTDGLIAVLDRTKSLSTVNNRSRVEQIFGKIFSEFTCQDMQIGQSIYAQNADSQRLSEVDSKCAIIFGQLRVPTDVCMRNSVISPLSLDELWRRFGRSQIEDMIPLDPSRSGSLERMRHIFQIIDEVFIQSGNRSWFYYATLAYWWVSGQTLKNLISNYLNYNKVSPTRTEVNKAIRTFLEALEQRVRFVYVKYLKAYIDTLQEFLVRSNRDDLKSSVSPLHLYVEYGARDQVLVMLMSLGLSRTTSIFVRPTITQQQEISRDSCWQKLKQLPLRAMGIPEVCKHEIRQLTGHP
jgi:superfamily II DNA/RNA helicase